jgi:hypothetical protein
MSLREIVCFRGAMIEKVSWLAPEDFRWDNYRPRDFSILLFVF